MSTAEQKQKDKDILLDVLYSEATVGTQTTEQVVSKLINAMDYNPTEKDYKELIEIVRPYKVSRKHLENTVNALYKVFREFHPTPDVDWDLDKSFM